MRYRAQSSGIFSKKSTRSSSGPFGKRARTKLFRHFRNSAWNVTKSTVGSSRMLTASYSALALRCLSSNGRWCVVSNIASTEL